MQVAVETPGTEQPLNRAALNEPKRGGAMSWTGKILGWIVLLAITVVALGVVAVTVGPKLFTYQALVVRSGSMAPTIPTGSIVFYRKVEAAKVKVGDIIVFRRPGDPTEKITHRVFSIGTGSAGKYFTTKGDANGVPDDWQIPAVGTGWVSFFHLPYIGYALVDLQSTLGRLLLLIIPALALGLITLFEIWRDRGGGATA